MNSGAQNNHSHRRHTGNRPFQSLSSRLSLWIIAAVSLITLAILGTNYYLSRNLLEDYVERLARKTAASTVKDVETVLHSVASNADSLAVMVSALDVSKGHIEQMIQAFVKSDKEIFGMTVALEPNIVFDDNSDFAPYYYKKNHGISYKDLANDSYRYRSQHWYTEAKKAGKAIWSEPYIDVGGGDVHMVTYSTPVYLNESKTFAGITTADIKLSWLDDVIKRSKIGKEGFGIILSADDLIIAHPDKHLHMKNLRDTGISEKNWEKYLNSKTSTVAAYFYTECKISENGCWVAIKTLEHSGWKIIIVISGDELILEINQLTKIVAIVAASGLLLSLFFIGFITRRLTSPLKKLAVSTRDIGAGHLDKRLPKAVRNDEIGVLTDDFDHMRASLKAYIAELQETTAKQQRLESEIQIAKDIQMSMIPGGGTADILDEHFQLYALMKPAKTVGGDLYYFQVWEDSLRFIIGDVSDKGVPAALFMAKTVTLFTRALKENLKPGDTLVMMNEILSQNNDACMFVTALCGQIDLRNGKALMANAGHMNPFIKTADDCKESKIDGGTALGLLEGIQYQDVAFTLDHGDTLVMYTDGISEAHDSEDNQYTDERLQDLLTRESTSETRALGDSIIRSVENFSQGTEQFDDITLFIIRYE